MTDPPSVPAMNVYVKGSDVVIAVRDGEPLMRAAERLSYFWPTICHGQAECTACWIETDDPDAFEPPRPVELDGLTLFEGRSFYVDKNVRLACQARPLRDTVVVKRGVRLVTEVTEPRLSRTDIGPASGGDESDSPPAQG